MPSFMPNHLIKELRKRRQWTRYAIQNNMATEGLEDDKIISQLTIMRAENGQQNLRSSNFHTLMDAMEMPVDAFFCPCMENLNAEHLQQLDALRQYTMYAKENPTFYKNGLKLLNQMNANPNFAKGINKQLLISQEVVLREAKGHNPIKIRELAYKGLEITYPEIKNKAYDGDMLIFDEAPLLHCIARTYLQEGDINQAINLLRGILTGITLLPQDDKEKLRMLAPILLTLAQCHIGQGNYSQALETCEAGHEITIKRNSGQYAPDFIELKVLCKIKLGQKHEIERLILQALAGYMLLRRYTKADKLMQLASTHQISINTHGMETIRPQIS